MNTERFDDEILSAIIDGEADQEIVASVSADPAARARLEQLRAAVSAVQSPVPEATPERRAASIAAAMAAATPAPDVSSLAAARHSRTEQARTRRLNPQWIAIAAAAILLVVAIPLLVRSSNDRADFATSADDTASLAADDAGGDESADSADSAEEVVEQATAAADGEAMADEDAMEPESDSAAMDDADDSAADVAAEPADAAEEASGFRLAEAKVANSVEVLEDLISIGSITPELTADEVIAEGVPPECVDPLDVVGGPTFALAFLDPFGGGQRLVLISFNADGGTTSFDAEDCSLLG